MPEVDHAVGAASHESRTEHNVGTTLHDRFKKNGVFTRVILQVGILNDYYVASGCLETGAQSCALAKIAFLQHDLIDPPGRFRLKKFSRSIGRPIIYDDDFDVLNRC